MVPPDCYARVSCFMEDKPVSLEERAKDGTESPISGLANLFGGSRNRKSPMSASPSHKGGESTKVGHRSMDPFIIFATSRPPDAYSPPYTIL
jgi:hypothetical protein